MPELPELKIVYNTRDEVDILVAALDEVGRLFG